MNKSVGAGWKLPAKQHSQSSPFSPKLGWIGCAIQQATYKRLPGFSFFFFFHFNIFIFILLFSFSFIFLNTKPLRPKPAHFCHLIFQLQVVCHRRQFFFDDQKHSPHTLAVFAVFKSSLYLIPVDLSTKASTSLILLTALINSDSFSGAAPDLNFT